MASEGRHGRLGLGLRPLLRILKTDLPLWCIRARSPSWGTPQKGHENQAAGQPAEIPVMLLEAAGETHYQGKLQKKLWPADTFVDSSKPEQCHE